MKSLADALPPEFAKKLHPDWTKNEAAYWALRDSILEQYRGRWIAFADGTVILAASTPLEVFVGMQKLNRHPFIVRVGHENEPWYQIRRASFAYDTNYSNEPLPVMDVEFRAASGFTGQLFNHVIPDTGADTTVLPWSDCEQLHLDLSQGVPGIVGGITGDTAVTVGFLVWVLLDGEEYPCQLQVDFRGRERILRRDVLNKLDVLFRGPSGEIIINP